VPAVVAGQTSGLIAQDASIVAAPRPHDGFATADMSELARQQALAPAVRVRKPRAIHRPKRPRQAATAAPGSPIEDVAPQARLDGPSVPSPSPFAVVQGTVDQEVLTPPDTNGAVGPGHIVNAVNDQIRITTRAGAEISLVPLDTFFSSLNGGGYTVSPFDPRILYDPLADRWILHAVDNAQHVNSSILMAASATGDPTGAWSIHRFDADATNVAWADYGSLGYNKDWVAVSVNMFTVAANDFVRADFFVFSRSDLYDGGPLTNNYVAGGAGALTGDTYAPAVTMDAALGTLYMVQTFNSGAGQLHVAKITGTPPAVPVITGGLTYPDAPAGWAVFGYVDNRFGFAPQLGTENYVENNDDRVQSVVYRNGSLWVAHTVFLPAGTPTRSAIQWWQLDPTIETGLTSAPLQRGVIEDPAATNCNDGAGGVTGGCSPAGTFYAFPFIIPNQDDHVLVGFARMRPDEHPSAAYAYRDSADAPGTMRDPVVFQAGAGFYDPAWASSNRWGDYSIAQTDPVNDCNFWTAQEYTVGDDLWATAWAHVQNPGSCSDRMFGDGFEAGTTYGLVPFTTTAGSPAVSGASPLDGFFSLATTANGTSPVWVQYQFPVTADELYGSFQVNTNGFDPGMSSNKFRTRLAIDFGASTRMIVIVLRRRPADGFALHARGRKDDGTRWQTPFFLVSDGPHTVKYHWRRSSGPGMNDGQFELYIDGALQATVSSLDNDLIPIESGRVGIMSPKAGISGTLKYDRIAWHRQTMP
jgi:hypothetical protein